MTTAHPRTHVGFGHDRDWLWIALTAALLAILAGAVSWVAFRPTSEVVLTEYDHEVTPIHIAAPGVTTPYFGYSGDLREVVAPVSGFDLEDDTTTFHIAAPGVTTPYFGYSGEMWPPSEYDHEVTPIHIAVPGVTTPYFGYSGELNPEN